MKAPTPRSLPLVALFTGFLLTLGASLGGEVKMRTPITIRPDFFRNVEAGRPAGNGLNGEVERDASLKKVIVEHPPITVPSGTSQTFDFLRIPGGASWTSTSPGVKAFAATDVTPTEGSGEKGRYGRPTVLQKFMFTSKDRAVTLLFQSRVNTQVEWIYRIEIRP